MLPKSIENLRIKGNPLCLHLYYPYYIIYQLKHQLKVLNDVEIKDYNKLQISKDLVHYYS